MRTDRETGKRANNTLSAGLMFRLMEYVKAHYTESQKTDAAFAEIAAETLGFPVTEGNVGGARRALEIQSNYAGKFPRKRGGEARTEDLATKEDINLVLNELSALNKQINECSRRIETYFNPGMR